MPYSKLTIKIRGLKSFLTFLRATPEIFQVLKNSIKTMGV